MDQLKKVAESGPKRAKGPIKMKVVEHEVLLLMRPAPARL